LINLSLVTLIAQSGGNATVLVSPLASAFNSLRGALIVVYPGFFLLSSALFGVVLYSMRSSGADQPPPASTMLLLNPGRGVVGHVEGDHLTPFDV